MWQKIKGVMISFLRRKIYNLISDKKFSEILHGSVWALGAKVLATGLGLITTVIIARFYGLVATWRD